MSTIKISNLPSASALTGTEVLPIVQSNTTSQTTTQDIANLAGGSTYRVYTALLTQSSTNNPTAIILENTIGTVTLSRGDVGVYYISCPEFNFFTLNKTFISPIVTDNALKRYTMRPTNPTTIELITFNDFTLTPPVSSDGLLNNDGIEIRVYN
jgi:hypothetical protein